MNGSATWQGTAGAGTVRVLGLAVSRSSAYSRRRADVDSLGPVPTTTEPGRRSSRRCGGDGHDADRSDVALALAVGLPVVGTSSEPPRSVIRVDGVEPVGVTVRMLEQLV